MAKLRLNRRKLYITLILVVGLFGTPTSNVKAQEALRLGWQTPWATQGQLVMALKHTNIIKLLNLKIKFLGFSYGAPLNIAAIGGEVDLLLTADQPALVLLSKLPKSRIVARMMYNRACIYVPVRSPLTSLSDFRRGSIKGPVGAAAERVMLAALRQKQPNFDNIRFGSLNMGQQASLLKRAGKNASEWPGTQVLYGFDPLPAVFELANLARMLECGRIISVVVASKNVLEKKRAQLEQFLSAFRLSWLYYAKNSNIVNKWFIDESHLQANNLVLDKVAAIEPNRTAKNLSQIRLTFTENDLKTLENVSEFLHERKIIKKKIKPKEFIDMNSLNASLNNTNLKNLFEKIQPISNGQP